MVTEIGMYAGLASLIMGVLWLWFLYNRMVKYDQIIINEQQNIAAALKKRYDLVPSVVEITQTTLNYESLIQVTATVQRHLESGIDIVENDQDLLNEAENLLAKEVTLIKERYPDVKTSESINQLFSTLVETENSIAASRRLYNRAAALMQKQFELFPNKYFAAALGFLWHPFVYFELASSQSNFFDNN